MILTAKECRDRHALVLLALIYVVESEVHLGAKEREIFLEQKGHFKSGVQVKMGTLPPFPTACHLEVHSLASMAGL